MKTFNLNIVGGVDIIIQTPDELDMQREEAYAVALIQLQEKITDGVYPINQRVWPCIFCDQLLADQADLMGHVRSQEHLSKVAGIQQLAGKHMKKQQDEKEEQEEASTYQFEPSRKSLSSSEYHKEYMKQYYIRKQLGEI